MSILLGDFNAKLGREDIFKPTTGNESLHQNKYDNGVSRVNFVTPRNLVAKSTIFSHRNIHKYTCTYPDGKTHYQIETCRLTGVGIRIYSIYYISGQLTEMLNIYWWLEKLGKDWQ
jgi:hypothetical protein